MKNSLKIYFGLCTLFLSSCYSDYETRYKPIVENPSLTSQEAISACRPIASKAENLRLSKLSATLAGAGGTGSIGATGAGMARAAQRWEKGQTQENVMLAKQGYEVTLNKCVRSYGYSAYRVCVSKC